MQGIDSVNIKSAIVHKVGNPARGERLQLSENSLSLNDLIVADLLKHYFLKPFNENEQYHFTHISNLELNEVYEYSTKIFENHKSFKKYAALIAQFLYAKSTHVKIKEGELYVVLFENIGIDGQYTEAVGIFKSESTETFLRVFQHGTSLEVGAETGIDLKKMDKGCLIFNVQRDEGYIVLNVDNLNKQQGTQYWMDEFLQIKPYAGNYHQTDKAMDMCKLFISNEYQDKFEVTKSDQIHLFNKSMEFFRSKEQFTTEDFSDEVLHHPEVVEAFQSFKERYQSSKDVSFDDPFEIHLAAVKKQQRHFKSVLKLDKNFHVYIHGRRELIEKGFDNHLGKNFYKLFFDEET